MKDFVNSFSSDWTWLLPGIPWLFVAKKTYDAYQKYGAKTFGAIVFHLIFIGISSAVIGFAILGGAALSYGALTGSINSIQGDYPFEPHMMAILSIFPLAFYFSMGFFIFRKSLKRYRELTCCNPLNL